jgi:8-oxo-dGTP pyrophosphatase MutT (NUDIX family)
MPTHSVSVAGIVVRDDGRVLAVRRRDNQRWVFRCSPIGGRLTTTDEAISVRWLSIDQIEQHIDPAYVVRVTDAFAEGAAARVHDGIDLVYA